MKCPFCGGKIKKDAEFLSLSFKRRQICKFIKNGGPGGVGRKELKNTFFPNCRDTTIRTTINHINKKIYPIRIESHNGRVRFLPSDDT